MVVCETHLSPEQTNEIQTSHIGRRLQVFNSPNPEDPNTRGIALVLNRELTNIKDVTIYYLIPDRIYVSNRQFQQCKHWEISDAAGKLTDHRLVTVTITAPLSPHVGRGNYSIPLFILQDTNFMSFVHEAGSKLDEMIELSKEPENQIGNIQTHYHSFKQEILQYARKRAKIVIGASREKKKNLSARKRTMLQTKKVPAQGTPPGNQVGTTPHENLIDEDQEPPQSVNNAEEELAEHIYALQHEIDEITEQQRDKQRVNTQVKCFTELDHITKFTVSMSKDSKPRDTITFLQRTDTDQPIGSKRSSEMAEIARDYHQALQYDPSEEDLTSKQESILAALEHIHPVEISSEVEALSKLLSEDDIAEALKQAKVGTAAGVDGIPYELWQQLHKTYLDTTEYNSKKPLEEQKPTLNIIKILASIFNDIEKHGVTANSDFALGWMCPIWKKKDKSDIANYRPITVLNTDYKLLTKTLSNKLAKIAPHLVNTDQAGFMKGRKIQDQIFLAQQVVGYSSEQLHNGAIVALDQEKAYDKTNHTYLWQTLRKQGIPNLFIDTVKALYADAQTCVIINGEKSTPYKVTRGVQQGDPLSCLLFNLAIEPLASMVRSSNLQGMQIPGTSRRIIIKMFADDTTVYLNANDRLSDLTAILNKWCAASSAKFNTEKTEIIPVGNPTFRAHVANTKTFHDEHDVIAEAKIARDGTAVRILGGYVGNGIDCFTLWSPKLERIDNEYEKWENLHPTLEARRHIDQIVAGSITQYLTMVNGMPKHVLKHLQRSQREFMWGGAKSSPVQKAVLLQPILDGGKNLLDIEARNDALTILKLASYLNLDPTSRPDWAYFADSRFAAADRKSSRLNPGSHTQMFLQTWRPNKLKLPTDLREMVRVAERYNLGFEVVSPPSELLEELPLFHHLGEDPAQRQINNSTACKCLRNNHLALNVGDGALIAARLENPNHQPSARCVCTACVSDRNILNCTNPDACAQCAGQRINLIHPRWDPRLANTKQTPELRPLEEGQILLPPVAASLTEGFRIFRTDNTTPITIPLRARPTTPIQAYIVTGRNADRSGSCYSLWFAEGDQRNENFEIPRTVGTTKQAAEIVACLACIRRASPKADITLYLEKKSLPQIINKKLKEWEDMGWHGVPDGHILCPLLAELRGREGKTKILTPEANSLEALTLQNLSIRAAGASHPHPHPNQTTATTRPDLITNGAKLAALTQKRAYTIIKSMHKKIVRPATQQCLNQIVAEIQRLTGKSPTTPEIWRSIRLPNLSRQVKNFLWKSIHNAHRIGAFWKHIPDCEDRATCQTCSTEETLEHILCDCTCVGQDEVWKLAGNLWETTGKPWFKPSLGAILGVGLLKVKSVNKPDPGLTRLLHIIISESMFLIWKLRNQRVISNNGQPHTPKEIEQRWNHLIESRFKLECAMTNKLRFGKRALALRTLEATWRPVLTSSDDIPEHWVNCPRVLVGRAYLAILPPPPEPPPG
ncbi:unnamed protein product [Mycena citricolor]|uniref:Reverse transcriptase domain-containing protein n=1 Tax=Mycena citricolor TaxID=2018698 RepID=A0AAD2GWZ4_9AGAR|nr:unnamed protein product [Mycena citricolor]